jgi:hypothetical protein
VTVIGGRVGLDCRTSQPTPVITGFTLVGQTEAAIRYRGRQTLVAAGLKIAARDNAGPLIVASGGEGPLFLQGPDQPMQGQISLVDSEIVFESIAGGAAQERVAVRSNRSLYLNNVFVRGATAVVTGSDRSAELPGNSAGWLRVVEYAHGASFGGKGIQYRYPVYREGARQEQPVARVVQEEAPPPDLQSRHLWIPEITGFNGLETLPDDIASELQDLMLVRKPYSERSAKFQWFAETKNRHHARWNFQADGHWERGHFVVPSKGGQRSAGDGGTRSEIFGHCTHILSVGSRIGALAWQRYQFTMDTDWLRESAYPFIKGSAEFYRHVPNFKKDAGGKYHIHHLNNGESAWNSSDPPNEVNAMHTIFPLAHLVPRTSCAGGRLALAGGRGKHGRSGTRSPSPGAHSAGRQRGLPGPGQAGRHRAFGRRPLPLTGRKLAFLGTLSMICPCGSPRAGRA